MKNELLTIGPFTIYGYGLMIGLGVVAAYFTMEARARKLKLDYERVFWLVIWCVIGGILGAKLLYWITEWKAILENPRLILDSQDGFVVYGGIFGGILAGYLYCKKSKLKFLAYFDLAMPSIALAQGFGRIGCFLAGCCYGKETDGWCAVTFQNSAYAPNHVPLIPTQLISSGLDFIHFGILLWIASRKKTDGMVAAWYLILYSLGRFGIECFRGDLVRGSVGALSTSQFISIFTLMAGIGFAVWLQRKQRLPKQNTEK